MKQTEAGAYSAKKTIKRMGLDTFISGVAAAEPLPGGGSVAALTGALAVALGEMMAGLTEDKARFASVRHKVLEIHSKLSTYRKILRSLVQEDASAYSAFLEVLKLPQHTEKQRKARAKAIEHSIRGTIETPLRTARILSDVLEQLKILSEIGNPNAKSDLAVGVQLAYASLKGVQYNVLENASRLKGKALAGIYRNEVNGLVRKGYKALQYVDQRMANG